MKGQKTFLERIETNRNNLAQLFSIAIKEGDTREFKELQNKLQSEYQALIKEAKELKEKGNLPVEAEDFYNATKNK